VHQPYAVLVSGGRVKMLHGRFRIAQSFPDLTMGTFMKISGAPGGIAKVLGGFLKCVREGNVRLSGTARPDDGRVEAAAGSCRSLLLRGASACGTITRERPPGAVRPPPNDTEPRMKGEFMKFLKEYGVIGLAIGVIIGSKAGELVKAIVDGMLMPVIGLVLPSGDWQSMMLGPMAIGQVLAALINFVIVAWIVFMFAKKVLKEDSVGKK
jgi:large conductance mechanosensitive channel